MLIVTQKDENSETAFFESSNVLYIKYRDDLHKMAIIFEKGGYYLYHDVPKYVYLRIKNSESQGKKIHELLIKDRRGKVLYKEEKIKTLKAEELNLLKEEIEKMKTPHEKE